MPKPRRRLSVGQVDETELPGNQARKSCTWRQRASFFDIFCMCLLPFGNVLTVFRRSKSVRAQDAESDKDRGLIAQFRALRCIWISFLTTEELLGLGFVELAAVAIGANSQLLFGVSSCCLSLVFGNRSNAKGSSSKVTSEAKTI